MKESGYAPQSSERQETNPRIEIKPITIDNLPERSLFRELPEQETIKSELVEAVERDDLDRATLLIDEYDEISQRSVDIYRFGDKKKDNTVSRIAKFGSQLAKANMLRNAGLYQQQVATLENALNERLHTEGDRSKTVITEIVETEIEEARQRASET